MRTGLPPEIIISIDRYVPYLQYDATGRLLIAGVDAQTLIAQESTPHDSLYRAAHP